MESYIETYNKVLNEVGDKDSAIAILHEIGKDKRAALMRAEKPTQWLAKETGDYPATPKQIAYLERMNEKVPENLTKAQASELIDSAKSQKAELIRKWTQ